MATDLLREAVGGLAVVAQNYVHTATILTRPTEPTGRDGDNQPIYAAAIPAEGIRCRYADLSRAEIVSQTQAGVTAITASLQLGMGTPVAQRSKVSAIKKRDGSTRAEGEYEVAQVLTRQAAGAEFQVCLLRKVE